MDEVIYQPRLKCSRMLANIIDTLRGENIDVDQFFAELLTLGVGHKIEEMLLHQRDATYKRVIANTQGYQSALPNFQFKPAPPLPPDVIPFGRDVTYPKVAR